MSNPMLRLLPLLVLAAAGTAGCSNMTVREGIWELSFEDVKRRVIGAGNFPDAEVPPPKKLVRLQILSSDGDVETAVITHLATARDPEDTGNEEDDKTPRQTSLKPMRLRIVYHGMDDADGLAPVSIEHEDGSWIWRMWGTVADPESMGGHFASRGRYKENLMLEGNWNLRWKQEE